jgi:hypothetical protein
MAVCSVADCGRPVEGRGLCSVHYGRWRRGAAYEAPLTRTPRGLHRICTVAGCGRTHMGKRLCALHLHRMRTGAPMQGRGAMVGEAHPRSTLTAAQVREIRSLKAAGWTMRAIARHLQVGYSPVRDVLIGRTWKHL